MNKSCAAQFAVYSLLLTLGVGLMLVHIPWLMLLGLALVVLSPFFSARQQDTGRRLTPFFIFLAGAILFMLIDRDVFTRTPPEPWYLFVLAAVWIWGVVQESLRWRAIRKSPPETAAS